MLRGRAGLPYLAIEVSQNRQRGWQRSVGWLGAVELGRIEIIDARLLEAAHEPLQAGQTGNSRGDSYAIPLGAMDRNRLQIVRLGLVRLAQTLFDYGQRLQGLAIVGAHAQGLGVGK